MGGANDDPNDGACTSASRLPDWILSECATGKEASEAWHAYRLVRTAANGDCLFHSVRLCMMSVLGRPGAPTSRQLREAVARTVLDRRDATAQVALVVWRDVLRDAIAMGDRDLYLNYAHARALLRDHEPFGQHARQAVYDAMCQSSIYWGDEYALKVLERITGMTLVVVGRETRALAYSADDGARHREKRQVCRGRLRSPSADKRDRGATNPNRWFGVLCLDGVHYRPIALRIDSGHYATAFGGARSVPRFVRAAFAAVASDAATSAAAQIARRLDPFASIPLAPPPP